MYVCTYVPSGLIETAPVIRYQADIQVERVGFSLATPVLRPKVAVSSEPDRWLMS